MTAYLDRAENEIARLYAENTDLRADNERLLADQLRGARPKETSRREVASLEERVETYFNSGQPKEPAGRLILDLLRALKGEAK